MKENQHVKPVINPDAATVTFTVKGYDNPLVLHMERLHPDIIRRAAMVGMAQVRIVDAAAVGLTDKDGNIIREADRLRMKYEGMQELIAHYESGTDQWTRTGSGNAAQSGITLEAIARHYHKSLDEARAMVEKHAATKHDGDTRKALAKLAGAGAIAKLILVIKSERLAAATPSEDADALLDELAA